MATTYYPNNNHSLNPYKANSIEREFYLEFLERWEYNSLAKIRYEFFNYIVEINEYNIRYYREKFIEFREQDLYLKFHDQDGDEYFFMAKKRGNLKHKKEMEMKLADIIEFIKDNLKMNRNHSNLVFLTLTFDRCHFMSNRLAWRDLSYHLDNYMNNRKAKLRKKGIKVLLFLKVYEYNPKDFYPHVHIIMLLNKPLVTFHHKGKIRFASKRRLFEWDLGYVDAFSPNNLNSAIRYLTKYILDNYFGNDTNEQDTNNGHYNTNIKEQDKVDRDTLLTILWLYRYHTISHSRLSRLDYYYRELPNIEELLIYDGLVIIKFDIELLEFIRRKYKINKPIFFKLYPNEKLIEIYDDILSVNYEFDENCLITK
jgi:hypothetical protein